MRTLLTLAIIIAMTSCKKDEVNETPTTNETTDTTNTVQDNDTIVAFELEEDTVISRVGCYYPMYEPK